MRVDFEYIKFRNFGSYGNNFTQYNFTTGLYNLFGAIGQGKSTVLSALYFCLYGKTFKVNISELINDVNESELETECKFSIGLDKYIVKRGLKPGYITVEKNGMDIDSLSRKKLIQEELDKILGMNSDMFKSIVGLSVQNNTPFCTMTKPEKRNTFDNLFGMVIFSELMKETKNEMSLLRTDNEVFKRSLNLYEQSLRETNEQLKSLEKINKESDENQQREIDELLEKIKIIKEEAKGYLESIEFNKNNLIDTKSSYKDMYSKFCEYTVVEDLQLLEREIAIIKHQENTLKNTDTCPTCLTVVTNEHKQSHFDDFAEKIYKLNCKKEELKKIKEQFDIEKKGLEDKNYSIKEIEYNIRVLNEKLKDCSNRIKDIEKQIEKKKNISTKVDVESLKKSFNNKIEEYKNLKTKISDNNEDMVVGNALSEILSDTGVKAYFMEKMLPWLNYKINEYLDRFDFSIRITINSSLNEVIETITGNTRQRSYYSFSGGERKIIDVSIWLSFIDCVKMFLNWNANLLFIDELFDEGTDSETIEKIINSLGVMTTDKNMNITLISHKNPDVKFDGKFLARKIDKFSKLEEIV